MDIFLSFFSSLSTSILVQSFCLFLNPFSSKSFVHFTRQSIVHFSVHKIISLSYTFPTYCPLISVTRSSSKKWPKYFQQLSKKLPMHFFKRVRFFEIALKHTSNIFVCSCPSSLSIFQSASYVGYLIMYLPRYLSYITLVHISLPGSISILFICGFLGGFYITFLYFLAFMLHVCVFNKGL